MNPISSRSRFDRPLLAALLTLGALSGPSLSDVKAQAVPIFVTLRTTQVASGTTPATATTSTIVPPGPGWSYSAAAPVSGTTWNQILRPNPGIASGVGATAGTFVMNSANNIALAAANGGATGVRLTGTIIIGDTTGATRTEPATGGGGSGVLAPAGLMDGAWRIFSGSNTTRFTFTGLPAGAHYYLYCYGTSGASGCQFSVSSPFLAAGDTSPKSTTGGNSGNLFVTDGTTYSLYSGASVQWAKFHVVADASGALAVGTAKNASSQQFFNGFQLMPYPVATITLQPPAEVTATLGGSVALPVTATGDGTLSYQWRKDGVAINPTSNPSAATATLALGNVQASDAGSYDVVITNFGGPVTSAPSVVTVGDTPVAPTISTPPSNQTATTGGSVLFSVVANGTAPLGYTWQKSTDNVTFADLAGANSVQLSLTGVQAGDAGYYRVIVANPVGSATSAVATLTVAPVITAQPSGGTVSSGAAANLSVVADVGAGAPSPTTYVWKKNGTTVTDGAGLSGATTGTLQFASFTAANSGVYAVTVSNPAGAVTSKSVYLGTPTTLANSLWPANNATGVNRDTPPTLRFSGTPVVGTVGQVRVYDASNDALVETIDLSTLTLKVGGVASYRFAAKTIGDRTYDYFPIVVVGNDARIALKSSTTLAYNKTYYVQIDPGVLLDASGASFPGIGDKTTWRFSTKPSGLANTATSITVAADGSGDFTTLQGAIDLIPFSPANTTPRRIALKNGIYHEQINLRIGQNNVTIQGDGRAGTVIQYLNNNDLLPPGGAHFTARSVVRTETNDFALKDVTVRNLTLKGGGQAEAIAAQGSRVTISRCNFLSFQDTLFIGQQAFVTDCYVEGDTDFIWGGNALFQRCEFKMMFPGYHSNPRNSAAQIGYVFNDCKFTRSSLAAVPNGSGYFSRDFGSADSMFALFNCAVDRHIANVGWNVSATDLTAVRYWEYNSRNLDGTTYDVSVRPTWNHMSTGAPGASAVLDHQQVDAITAAYYSNPTVTCGFTPAVAPAIDTQPASQTADAGAIVVLSVGATVGYPTATFQWFKNGVAIAVGANASAATAQLSLANVQVADVGVYTVVIGNSAGTVTSSPAAVLINGQPPVILAQPAGQTVAPGGAVGFTVNALGAEPLAYQWSFNGTPLANGTAGDGTVIAGATAASLGLSNTQPGYEGSYTVAVTDANGSTPSSSASLIVDAIPTITSQPISRTVVSGSSVGFSVTATGATTYQYQWKRNGTAIPGATAATLALNGVTLADTAGYTVTVSSRVGAVTSAVAALTVAQFALPNIPAGNFDVISFGAVGDNATDNTAAFQSAINAAGAAGGGTVNVPAGTFLCGPITLVSGTHLHLADGCVLKMLPMGQWPNAPYLTGSTPGFIRAENVHDVQVSGAGLIDGQGQPWWDRVDGTNGVPQQPTVRPGSAIAFIGVTNGAILGVSTLNTPNINVQVGGSSRFVVLSGVTVTDPESSPNTDGIHLAGRDLLIDHCTVSNGDDNIVINTGNSGPETSDIAITNCILGTGHGCSIGSFTSASGKGIKNVKVSGLVFNGTGAGINLKSAPGRGGVVQNLEYSNLVMNNVASPFTISSYYGTVGNAGATGSSRITPTVVNAYNTTPPVALNSSFLPEWKNITISDVTIAGSVNYSTIWGLPNRPLGGITFRNITQTGAVGFQIYNAQGVVFEGTNNFTLNSGQPTFTTCNANVITAVPVSATINRGAAAGLTASATGASGVGGIAPTYAWRLGGTPLANGPQPDGTVVSGATTTTLGLTNTGLAFAGTYTFAMTNLLDGYDAATSAATPASVLSQVSAGATLTVLSAPILTNQPVSQTVAPGAGVTFSVGAAGFPAVSYQWFKNGQAIAGATAADLTLNNVSLADWGAYSVAVGNSLGSVASDVATLRVAIPSALWADAYGLDPLADGAPDADPDGDGFSNRLEFGFGLSPVAASTPSIDFSGGVLLSRGLPFLRRDAGGVAHACFVRRKTHVADGLSYAPQFSADLAGWQTSAEVPAVLAADAEYELVELSPPSSLQAEAHWFFRVIVSEP